MKLPPEEARGPRRDVGRPEGSYAKNFSPSNLSFQNPPSGIKRLGTSAKAIELGAIEAYMATGSSLAEVKVGPLEIRNLRLPTVGIKASLFLTSLVSAAALWVGHDRIGHVANTLLDGDAIPGIALALFAHHGNRTAAMAFREKRDQIYAQGDPKAIAAFDKQLQLWTGLGRYAANGIALVAVMAMASHDALTTFGGAIGLFVAASMWGITGMSTRMGFHGAAQQVEKGKSRPESKINTKRTPTTATTTHAGQTAEATPDATASPEVDRAALDLMLED